MHGRWVNLAVIVLWLVTMSWLVTEKVLPPLLIGEPPSSKTVLAARVQQPLVGWKVCWNEEPIGWALSRTQRRPDESTEIHSRVHFERLPLGDLTPGWLRAMFDSMASVAPSIAADARGTMLLDPDGRLSRIESRMRFEPLGEEVALIGRVEGTQLKLMLRSREYINYQTAIAINAETLHGQVFSPQTQLPGLHEGQTWTVEVCSPLRYPGNPVEILHAEVAGQQRVLWGDRMILVWLVKYHDNPGSRLSNKETKPRGRLWVRPDGTVLVQEIHVFGSWMKFVRMSEEEADELAQEHGPAGAG